LRPQNSRAPILLEVTWAEHRCSAESKVERRVSLQMYMMRCTSQLFDSYKKVTLLA